MNTRTEDGVKSFAGSEKGQEPNRGSEKGQEPNRQLSWPKGMGIRKADAGNRCPVILADPDLRGRPTGYAGPLGHLPSPTRSAQSGSRAMTRSGWEAKI